MRARANGDREEVTPVGYEVAVRTGSGRWGPVPSHSPFVRITGFRHVIAGLVVAGAVMGKGSGGDHP